MKNGVAYKKNVYSIIIHTDRHTDRQTDRHTYIEEYKLKQFEIFKKNIVNLIN